MTSSEWTTVVDVLNVAYAKDGKVMFDTPEKIQFWYSCLRDLDYALVSGAVKRIAMKNKYSPTIADIREECAVIMHGADTVSEAEAWSIVREALRDSTYHADEQFAEFPEIVKRAVTSPDRLREWCQLPSDTVGTVVRAEFRRTFESAQKQAFEEQKIGVVGKAIAEKLAKQLTMTRDEIQIGMKDGAVEE